MSHPPRLGEVQLFAQLAQGPATTVYKGYQPSLARTVLVKVLRPALTLDEERVARFEEEARLLARVVHPNVVALHSVGRADGAAYLIAEFVEGLSLADLMTRGPVPPPLAAYLLREVTAGLHAAHARGVLHRDLTPANVLVSHDGYVKLADFGFAALDEAQTEGGPVHGTPGYLAPEVIRGAPPSAASDLFALGATAFALLAGRPAFPHTSLPEALDAGLHQTPRLPTTVPTDLGHLVGTLLEKDPDRRFPSAAAAAEALDQWLEDAGYRLAPTQLAAFVADPHAQPTPVAPAPPAPVHAASALPSRRLWGWVAAALAGLVLIGWGLAQRTPPASTEPTLNTPAADARPADSMASPPAATRDAPREEAPGALLPAPESTATASRVASREPAPPEQTPLAAIDTAQAEAVAAVPEPVRPGTVAIGCVPWCQVVVEGEVQGQTPLLEPMALHPGRYQIELVNPSFPTVAFELDVAPGAQITRRVSLWDEVGRLWLDVNPWAEVLVDDAIVGTTPFQRPLILHPGARTVGLRHPSRAPQDTVLMVSPGDSLRLRVTLRSL
ncbi:MAG: protein kinase [Bacteroidota bacterium]